MKRAALVAACIATVGALVATSSAGAFNGPKQAKRNYIEMVVAYNECTAPNTTHRPSLAFPSCTPPAQSSANNPANVLTFNPAGAMIVDLKTMSGNVKIKMNGRGIYNKAAGGASTPYTGSLSATAVLRMTDSGCGPNSDIECTTADIPFPMPVNCTNSYCMSPSPNFNTILPGALSSGGKANLELSQLTLSDPDGDTFARGGLYIR